MIDSNVEYKKITFPNKEIGIILNSPFHDYSNVEVEWEFKSNDDIMELLLFNDALKRNGKKINKLVIQYFPYSRQDRVTESGAAFSLKVMADLINSLQVDKVFVFDPHSDVTPALLNNCEVIPQEYLLKKFIPNEPHWLVSPDAGAYKKISKFLNEATLGIVTCNKTRDVKTGEITGTYINQKSFANIDCYIIDDICDGGRTFIEIAKELKKTDIGKINLLVTHGFFTKGIEVFDGLIDEIYTSEGKIKGKGRL